MKARTIPAMVICALTMQDAAFAVRHSTSTFSGLTITVDSDVPNHPRAYQSLVDRDVTKGQPAYDYSVHIIHTGGRFRAFVGGRWKWKNGDGDHILQWTSRSGNEGTWRLWPNGPNPEFYRPKDVGEAGHWYSSNAMDPEVLLAADNKTWIMYSQVMVKVGDPTGDGQTIAERNADRIQVHTSTDCKHWTRFNERGVFINLPDPATTFLHHPETLYVPWDVDSKPYWIYVGVRSDGENAGIKRVRSADYKTYDYRDAEPVSGFAQYGNQLGYLEEAPGGPVFARLTFSTDVTDNKKDPCWQWSRDGVKWSRPQNLMGGTTVGTPDGNRHCFFLGFSTLSGRGKVKYLGGNRWQGIYGATTCAAATAPEIFRSEVLVGKFTISIDE